MTEKESVANPNPEREKRVKRKKRNLRAPRNEEEGQYADTTDLLLLAAERACAALGQKQNVIKQKDDSKRHDQEIAEQIKKEKRAARLERSLARKQKLKDAVAASLETSRKKKRKNQTTQH